jgi:hypothetical protein
MLAEIFMLRLEAAARVAAQEAPKYSPRTGAERKTSEAGAFTEYVPTGEAAALKMRPTTTLSVSTS